MRTLKFYLDPIQKGSILFPKKQLKYFYEPTPNSTRYLDREWITTLGYTPNTIVRYKINNDGLNQIPNYPATKSTGIYRIITLGDSFTFTKT